MINLSCNKEQGAVAGAIVFTDVCCYTHFQTVIDDSGFSLSKEKDNFHTPSYSIDKTTMFDMVNSTIPTELSLSRKGVDDMRRFMILSFLVLFLSSVGLFNCNTVEAKQALIVIFEWFGETPYSETRSILENKGVKVIVASSSVEPMSGHEKKLTVKPDMLLSQVRTAEYDAIVFIGGGRYPGDNADAVRIAKEGASGGKVLASYASGTFTLIKADVLKGKKIATGTDDIWVQKAGATRSSAPVERDGIIITGTIGNAQQFAETIAAALTAGSQ
jgi:putative intracellular protease/amidase